MMLYREGSDPVQQAPLQLLQPMHMGTVVLGLMIGIILFTLARRARLAWLAVWGAGLVVASLVYMSYAIVNVW